MPIQDCEFSKVEGVCDICGQSMKPLACSANMQMSEFYCEKCKKSYRMSLEHAKYFISQRR
jgi:tRNA(Ile2) C34 agmatinyltransferase TiaS